MPGINFAGGAYDVGSKPLSAQECINLYPEVMEAGGRERKVLRSTPGLTSFSAVGGGPVRGAIRMGNLTYWVMGTTLYSVAANGVSTSLGTIPGTGPVSMAENGTQIMILVSGQVVYADQYFVIAGNIGPGYIYDGSALSQITDPDFPSGDQGEVFWISDLGDGSMWLGSDFASAEGRADRLVTLEWNHRDLLLMGETTIETWRNTGDLDFPFGRQDGTFQERGCAAQFGSTQLDNTVFFLGDDRIVYRIDGYRPSRISNHGIENHLSSLTQAQIESAMAYTYTDRGHYFFVLTVGGKTWVYDQTASAYVQVSTWHERQTNEGRWRPNAMIDAFGYTLVGGNEGDVFRLDKTSNLDGGVRIERIRVTQPYAQSVRPLDCPRLELTLESGAGDPAETLDPVVELFISKDGGRTFSKGIQARVGKAEYDHRAVWRQLGLAREWTFKIRSTDSYDVTWYDLHADFVVGVG